MRKRRTIRLAAALLLLFLGFCAQSAQAREQADYTVEYIGRAGDSEALLGTKTYRAPAGDTVNVETPQFEDYEREAGQDLTVKVTADGKAVKKLYYTRIRYDRIVFQTQGSYIPSIQGCAGEDISARICALEEPVRQGYVFKGWDRELPSVMPEGTFVVNAVWEPGESRYTVLRWMENAEDDDYTLLGGTEVRTALTGTKVTASQEDIDRAGEMADWFPEDDYYKAFYGFDYAGCRDAEVTADGRAVLHLYYDREIWTINLHEKAEHESDVSDTLQPNEEIWYTARGKYGAPLPEDFPSFEEMERHYTEKNALQGMQFLGVRDAFEAVSRPLDTFYYQDLAKMDHTFDAYPWIDGSAHSIFVTYFVERSDGTFRRVGEESIRIEKDPDVYGAEVTVFHPDGLTCEEGWYATGSSPEACETGAKIPVLPEQMQGDGACVFRHVGSFLHVYMKKDLFTLRYMDIDEEGNDVVLQTRQVRYKDTVSLDYVPEEGHGQDRFSGWYRNPALAGNRDPLTALRMPAGDVSVYAGWEEAVWSVEFDPAGGVGTPDGQTVQDGAAVEMPREPARDGFLFLGWFPEAGGTDSRAAWEPHRPVWEHMTLFAGWYALQDTSYVVRHVKEGEEEPFLEEEGTGKAGDTVFAAPLREDDPGCPPGFRADGELLTLQEDGEANGITLVYRTYREAAPEEGPSAGQTGTEAGTETKEEIKAEPAIPRTGDGHAPAALLLSSAGGLLAAAAAALRGRRR